jgi:YHS domain-containing protein
MKFTTALRGPARRRLESIEKAEIVIGIPSYNNYATIAHVVETISHGLHTYFPDKRSIIIIADGGSVDDTREEALNANIDPWIEKVVYIYRGIAGKGSSLRAIFESASLLGAGVCVLCDSDLRSIKPEWVKSLIQPIYDGYEFVSPYYARYKYDGTITNNIVYNLVRAIYGKRIRQPIGGDFAISGELCKYYIDQNVWETDVGKFGIDIWMTTSAITKNFKICQANLGAKIHDVKDPGESLGPMFRQVIGTLFYIMEDTFDKWKDIRGSEPVEILGNSEKADMEGFPIDLENIINHYKEGFHHFSPLWESILSADDFDFLKKLNKMPQKDFIIPQNIWARIVYDLFLSFHSWRKDRFKLINIMSPLYHASVASFVNITKDMDNHEAELVVERQAEVFEEEKGYLISKWKEILSKEEVEAILKKEGFENIKDNVCGTMVGIGNVATKAEYKGKNYLFCSLSCKKKFEKNTEKYLGNNIP